MPDPMRQWQELNDQATQLMSSGDYAGAAGKLVAALDISKDHWVTWLHLGLCFFNLQDFGNAIIAFQNATTLNPHDAQAWNNLGTVLGLVDEWESAATAFDSGINADPKYAKNYLGRGNAYLMAGDRQNARAYFQRAIAVDPNYAKAKQALSQLD
jgi:tetratricopeptide (TPR) repeat protein